MRPHRADHDDQPREYDINNGPDYVVHDIHNDDDDDPTHDYYNEHADHLVVYNYDPDYLYDPIHHFIVRRPDDHFHDDD